MVTKALPINPLMGPANAILFDYYYSGMVGVGIVVESMYFIFAHSER